MEVKEMTVEQIENRQSEIVEALDSPDSDLNALEIEMRSLKSELETRKENEAKKAEIRNAVAKGNGKVIKPVIEERKMENVITRNSPEYIRAFAEYIQSGDDKECRALLTENGSGTVAVPELVYDEIKTAWDEEGIMRRVKKSYLKGNLKVGFEISATGATKQTEGVAVNEQSLVLGIVELKPDMIKKWISISNQALRLDQAEAYLRHIYRELAHHIAKKAADELIAKIKACTTESTTTQVGVPVVTSTQITLDLVAKGLAQLSDQAAKPVVMMNRATWAAFKTAQYAANYPVDPFEGLDVEFNNTITAFSAATTGVPYVIIGDLEYGAQANFPDGEEITVLKDPYTLANSNMVRFIGDEYVAIGVVAPNAFVKIIH